MKKARSNPKYLGDFTFPDHLELTASLDEAVLTSDVIISSVPTSVFAEIIQNIQSIDPAKPIIWTNKGLETNSSLFPHEIIHDHLINKDLAYGVLSGPSFAAELVRDLPTAVTLATTNSDLSNSVAKIFHHGSMRVYLSDDIAGVTVGGSLKNIIAIASGISDGMGFGNNARAALITRGIAEITRFGKTLNASEETFIGIAEITRFGKTLNASEETFIGLAGIGDLLLTCTGQYSRNREVGIRLAEGKSLDSILSSLGHVAEGVNACFELVKRIKDTNIDMPITCEVYRVLTNEISAKDAVKNLLSRSLTTEN
jgi:glycerol-3-phosphate dehydrogenase (NAD(P)+)